MLPKSRHKEVLHREQKRQLEINIIINEMLDYLKCSQNLKKEEINILEFGSGQGTQLPYLMKLGNVIASDIKLSPRIKHLVGVKSVECSISSTLFDDGQFNIIYSNHVLEHIDNQSKALRETQRIGADSCLYAFSVPTNIWLLLSIPAQYLRKLRYIFHFLSTMVNNIRTTNIGSDSGKIVKKFKGLSIYTNIKYIFFPQGHGIITNYTDCYRYFRIKNWQKIFTVNGFSIVKIKPLLIYGPSEWPIIKTEISRNNFCSSVLFLLKKKL